MANLQFENCPPVLAVTLFGPNAQKYLYRIKGREELQQSPCYWFSTEKMWGTITGPMSADRAELYEFCPEAEAGEHYRKVNMKEALDGYAKEAAKSGHVIGGKLSRRIRYARELQHISLQSLADKLRDRGLKGVSVPYIKMWEEGTRPIDPIYYVALAEELKLDYAWIMWTEFIAQHVDDASLTEIMFES